MAQLGAMLVTDVVLAALGIIQQRLYGTAAGIRERKLHKSYNKGRYLQPWIWTLLCTNVHVRRSPPGCLMYRKPVPFECFHAERGYKIMPIKSGIPPHFYGWRLGYAEMCAWIYDCRGT